MKTITLFILLFISVPLFSQSDSDSLKQAVYDFLISTRDIIEREKSINITFIRDLVTYRDYENQEYGIFSFGTPATSTYWHILLISNGKYTIVNMYEPLEKSLQSVLEFFKEDTIFSKEGVIKCIERILFIDTRNRSGVMRVWQNAIIGYMYELLEKSLQSVLEFLNANKSFSKENTIKYIEGVLGLYKSNKEAIPWSL